MPVGYGTDGKDKDGRAEGRGHSRDSRPDRDDHAAAASGRRRDDSLPPPPALGGPSQGRSQSRGQSGQPRSAYDRERYDRSDRDRNDGYTSEGRGEQSQSQADRDRDRLPSRDRQRDQRDQPRDRDQEYRDRDRVRERDSREAEGQRGGSDLRDHLNQMRGRERSPPRRQDQLNGSGSRQTPPRPPPPARPAGSGTSKFLVEELRKAGQSLLVGSRPTPEPRSGPSSPTRSGPPAAIGSAQKGSVPQHAQQQRRRVADSHSGSDDGMEAGEIAPDDSGDGREESRERERPGSERKRRPSRSPSEPPPPASKAARTAVSGPGGLLSRVFDDVESFRQQQAELEVDPDAPALVKSSPSGSDEEAEHELDVKYRRQLEAAKTSRGMSDDDSMDVRSAGSGDEARQGAAGVKSRWLTDPEPAHDNNGAPHAINTRAARPGASGDLTSESDDEGRSGSLPPSPRSMLNKTYNMLQECRGVDEFEKISRISEGTYGVVYKAREKKTGKLVALKMIKMEKEREGFPVTSIREINVLLNFHHLNIVPVWEIVVNPNRTDQVFMVMELMDHDLRSIIEPAKGKEIRMTRPFSVSDIKNLMLQLLRGVSYLHNNWVLHRDLKTSNILYNSKGELKICDFGLARQYGSPLKPYTHTVVTLWYRAPELLFGTKIYSTAIDMWSVGCIMGELLLGTALLPGQGEFEQIDKIVNLLGTPNEEVWPGLKELPNYNKIVLKQVPSQLRAKFQTSYGGGAMVTEAGFDLLSQLLAWDPTKRVTADEALEHRWFKETPLPQKQELMPTFAPR